MIKLIVSDMDGTLITHHSKISQKNLEAIRHAQKHGADFVIATGRDFHSMKDIIADHGISCMAILGNGAQFVDEKGHLLSSAYFPKEHFQKVIEIFDELNIHYMIFSDHGPFSTHDPQEVCDAFIHRCCVQFHRQIEDYQEETNMPCMHLKHIENVANFLKSDIQIIKVEAFSIDVELIAQAKEKLKEIEGIAYLSSFNDNVEVTDQHAQKGLILEEVIEKIGIQKDEVMVLGDGFNDLTMFERFPYSFAPENAEEGIKKLAYRVVKACEDDGVSQAIYMMIPKGN